MPRFIEIIARPESTDAVRDEFRRFLQTAKENGWKDLTVLFGFAWGNYIYDGEWTEEEMGPDELMSRVESLEAQNDGNIGSDDLYVTPKATGIEYTFCHEADIHLKGPFDSRYIHDEKQRYADMGWEVFERSIRT